MATGRNFSVVSLLIACLTSCLLGLNTTFQNNNEGNATQNIPFGNGSTNDSLPRLEDRASHDREDPTENATSEIESYKTWSLPAICEQIGRMGVANFTKLIKKIDRADPDPDKLKKALEFLPLIAPCCKGGANKCTDEEVKKLYKKLHDSGQRSLEIPGVINLLVIIYGAQMFLNYFKFWIG